MNFVGTWPRKGEVRRDSKAPLRIARGGRPCIVAAGFRFLAPPTHSYFFQYTLSLAMLTVITGVR